jgi:hypothetical protein
MSPTPCSTIQNCQDCFSSSCIPCSTNNNISTWKCISFTEHCPIRLQTCPSLTEEQQEVNLLLVMAVVLLSFVIAFAILYSQIRGWIQTDRRGGKKWLDEDERLVLHVHPDEETEMVRQ